MATTTAPDPDAFPPYRARTVTEEWRSWQRTYRPTYLRPDRPMPRPVMAPLPPTEDR